jgi:hypothetical protein
VHSVFWSVAVGYIIFLNVFWLGVKEVLRSNGFATSYVWHWHDLDYLNELVRREANLSRRKRFRLLRASFYAAIAFCPILLWLLDIFLA